MNVYVDRNHEGWPASLAGATVQAPDNTPDAVGVEVEEDDREDV